MEACCFRKLMPSQSPRFFMNIVFICQVIDQNHSIQASTLRWIQVLADKKKVRKVYVIALRAGKYDFNENVEVYVINGKNKLSRLIRFYIYILNIIKKVKINSFFIYQGGPYPALLLPFKLLFNISILQWKAHPYIDYKMQFYAKYCDDLIFTSTPNAFPLKLSKVKVIGNGINVAEFKKHEVQNYSGSILTVGRMMPSKKIELMIKAIGVCVEKFGKKYRLDIYGPLEGEGSDTIYVQEIKETINHLGLNDHVQLKGAINRNELPKTLSKYDLYLNLASTALDRSVLEAMSCELMVLSSNPCVEDVLSKDLSMHLMIKSQDVETLANKIIELLSLNDVFKKSIGEELREIVVNGHSDISLFDKVISETMLIDK